MTGSGRLDMVASIDRRKDAARDASELRMTRARPGLAPSDGPRQSCRTPLLLLGLTLALTAAVWSLAVREHEPSWLLRIEPLEDTSELRIKLRVWGTPHRDLVVRRVPAESALPLELPEALRTLPGDWRIEVELNRSGDDGSGAPVEVDLNGHSVLVVPPGTDGAFAPVDRSDHIQPARAGQRPGASTAGLSTLHARGSPNAVSPGE